eukprot:3478842-Rhodomonas_salina.2
MSLLSTMHVTAFQLPSLRPLAFRSHLWRPSCGLDQGKRFASDQRRTPARFTVVGCSDGPPEDPNRVSVTGVAYDGPEGCPTVTLFTKAECTLCDKVATVDSLKMRAYCCEECCEGRAQGGEGSAPTLAAADGHHRS